MARPATAVSRALTAPLLALAGRDASTDADPGDPGDPSCVTRQVFFEERLELVERNDVDAVVEVDVPSALHHDEVLGTAGLVVDVVAEVPRVRDVAGDQQDRSRSDVVEVSQRPEVDV